MAWNDEDDEDEATGHGLQGPDEADLNDEAANVPCPYCKREIHEDSPQCPYCGCYLSREDAPPGRREWWWFVAIGLVIVILVAWVIRRW
jgi:hypothetical protein